MIRVLGFLLIFLLFALNGSTLADGPKMPGKTDRCPVCGMFVSPYPDWLASLLFEDGSQLFFDGAKDLLRYYYSLPSKTDPRPRSEVTALYVTDYYSTRLMPIQEVFLVLGSDVFGPMGKELIPVAGEQAAKTFARDHGGEKIIRFEQLTPQLLPVD